MLNLFFTAFSPPRHLILLVISAWLGLTFSEKRTERHGISRENINNLIFYGLTAFILGGRISFILQNISAFGKSPTSAFSINPDLFDIVGALAAALLTCLVYGQRNQLSLWSTLDALTPFFATLGIGLGLSHLAAGTAFGRPTDLPWSIQLWNAQRHPSQIYETITAIAIFGLIWYRKHDSRPGLLFLDYLAVTSGAFVFLTAFRGDQSLILNGLKEDQVIALAVLSISFVLFEVRLKHSAAGSAMQKIKE